MIVVILYGLRYDSTRVLSCSLVLNTSEKYLTSMVYSACRVIAESTFKTPAFLTLSVITSETHSKYDIGEDKNNYSSKMSL